MFLDQLAMSQISTEHIIIGLLIFILTYVAIISEKLNRMIVAVVGAALMILFQIITQEEAVASIDFNTIGLLIGMMIIVTVIAKTGIFQFLAIKSAKVAKGDPIKILIYFSVITALASAFLNNVTTVLLIVPVTYVIADTLKISPIPYVMSEILVSNIGGAATLIGDPPNIMIGSATGFSFMKFLVNLFPLMAIIFAVTVGLIILIYKKSLRTDEESRKGVMSFDEKRAITDKKVLRISLVVLGVTILGFVFGEFIHIESATVAMFGAAMLLLLAKSDPEEIMAKVEWPTIFFFVGLFMIVGSLEALGIIEDMSNAVLTITKGSIPMTAGILLWVSAILSSVLDNVPYVATMIPLVQNLSHGAQVAYEPVWWALLIGACLGGNGTIIGASSNVVARDILEKQGQGFKISFLGYMKIGFPLMILSIVISTIYLFLVYL